jgi:5-methylcytosine-specific restriction endonuclease McrA
MMRKKYGLTGEQWRRMRRRVLKRDDYICYLCGGRTNSDTDPNDDEYPNAEHVVLSRKVEKRICTTCDARIVRAT